MSSSEKTDTSINKLLSKLAIAVRIANESIMCDIGLHSGQAQILISLWENDVQSQAELVRNLCVSPPTINKMVKRLVEAGFVTTQKCPEDKRLIKVRLTAKGARIQPKAEEQLKRLDDVILQNFSKTERLLIPILLEKIQNNLQSEIVDKT